MRPQPTHSSSVRKRKWYAISEPRKRRVQPDRDRSLGYAGNFGRDSAPPNTTKYLKSRGGAYTALTLISGVRRTEHGQRLRSSNRACLSTPGTAKSSHGGCA